VKTISEISKEHALGNVLFHKREESESFGDAVDAYINNKYVTSANICAVLYEKIFTTRLARETANPAGFIPSQHNLEEQLTNLLNREVQIIEVEKLSFRKITKQLVDEDVLTQDEKNEYDQFYTNIRNPVAHGLTLRLYEPMLGHPPKDTFEIDAKHEEVYKHAAKELIEKIYYLMTVKVLRKQ